jgi:hypothetical protein
MRAARRKIQARRLERTVFLRIETAIDLVNSTCGLSNDPDNKRR